MEIVFRKYDKNNKLDMLNKKLNYISQGRFELRKSKNNLFYIYDYDEKEIVRNKLEIIDILEVMSLYDEFKDINIKKEVH